MNRDEKIYVAGHCGLVGSAICRRLEAGSYQNQVLRDRRQLELTDQASVRSFFEKEKPDYVFLAAAKVGGIWANNEYPAEFIRDNLAIELNVIHESYRAGVKRLLFLGSSCIYPKHCPQPMKEEHLLTGELEPTNEAYAISKIAGIKMCQAYNRQYGTKYLAAMPTNLYGPNDNFDLMNSHVLPALIRKLHLTKLASEGKWAEIEADETRWGKIPGDVQEAFGVRREVSGDGGESSPKVVLWGTGAPRREFLHVDDLADACVFLMNLDDGRYQSLVTGHESPCESRFPPPSPITNHQAPALINIGTGTDQTIRELAELVEAVVGSQGEVVWDATKPDGTPRKLLDVSRLRGLGWKARVGLREGIGDVYRWYLEGDSGIILAPAASRGPSRR